MSERVDSYQDIGTIRLHSYIHVACFGRSREIHKLKNTKIHKLNTPQKKLTKQNTAKQNYPGLVAFYNTWPGKEVSLYYNPPEPIQVLMRNFIAVSQLD